MPDPGPPLSRSARRFDEFLRSRGLEGRVVELPESTRTATDAARAVGCELRSIVKSLIFRVGDDGPPVLVLVSGANRIDEARLAPFVGGPISRADPEFVRSVTGYAIGGVPPAALAGPMAAFVDYALLELPEIWAAAGTPRAVFRLTPLELLRLSGARAVPIAPQGPRPDGAGEWITFDCFGTLVDWRTGIVSSLAQLGIGRSAVERQRVLAGYLELESAVESGTYRSYREVMTETLVRAARRAGLGVTEDRASQLAESIPTWPVFPDTVTALRALRDGGRRLGILSNIDRDLLDRTVAAHDLPIERSVTAEEVRSYKPAPAHWIRFMQATGARSADVRHVSASYEFDLETANALGFRTVFVDRYGPPPAGRPVGEVVRTLGALSA